MERIRRNGVASAALGVVLWLGAGSASAQQCDVFTDVLASDGICNSVQWLKNRAITLGCGAGTTYCPNDAVSRAAMALFMNRLGVAITPKFVGLQAGTGGGSSIPPTNFIAVCQTNADSLPAVNYPQRLRARGTVSAQISGSAVGLALYRSYNGGPFFSMVSTELLVSAPSGDEVLHWSTNVIDVPPGNAISVAIGVINRGAGTLTVASGGRCAIEVDVVSANPSTPPFDE